MAKHIEINCSPEMANILADALKMYAHLAFPDSGSPCQMVSREALMDAAEEFESSYQQTGVGTVSSRIRVMLKAAVKNYFRLQAEHSGYSTQRECELFLGLCRGGVGTQEDLLAARVADRDSKS